MRRTFRFFCSAQGDYRDADGNTTSELKEYRYSLRPLRELYAELSVEEFGPLKLKAVRQKTIDTGWSRKLVNGRIGRIRRVFKWGVENELVPVAVHQALTAVAGLQRNRTGYADKLELSSDPTKPVIVKILGDGASMDDL